MVERKRRKLALPSLLVACMMGGAYYMVSHGTKGLSISSSGGSFTLADYNLHTPTVRHGRLEKKGPLASLSLVGEGWTKAELCYPPEWRQARLHGIKKRPPSRWCAILWNHKYKVIYIKNPKTAGTTLASNYFTECGTEGATDTCLRLFNYSRPKNVQRMLKAWDKYFVFTFSRNVLSRAISQYQYLATFLNETEGCPRVAWDEHCADPFLLGDICANPTTAHCCSKGAATAEHQYTHAAPQVNCFLTKKGESAVDWVGRVEHFEDDLKDLVSILNARGGGVPLLPTNKLPAKANYNASPCTAPGGIKRSSSSSSAGAVGQASRRLLDVGEWGWDARNYTENPCDKHDLFRGQHAHCYPSIMSFYSEDLAWLMQ